MPLTKIKSLGITDGTIALADLSATGTKDSTTFLRGDNTFATAGATAGQVIQVLGATDTTQRSTTSTSFVTGSNTLSVTITPSATSSKFAIFVSHYAFNANAFGDYTIYRDSTNLGGSDGLVRFNSYSGNVDASSAYNFLDSPNTTSAITYQAYMKTASGNTIYMGKSNQTAQIIVMEIKG